MLILLFFGGWRDGGIVIWGDDSGEGFFLIGGEATVVLVPAGVVFVVVVVVVVVAVAVAVAVVVLLLLLPIALFRRESGSLSSGKGTCFKVH